MSGGANTDQLQLFGKGSKVEVNSEEEGLEGAWFAATVVDPPNSSSVVYVEYETLLAEDESTPLRERVNAGFVRPSPPPICSHPSFQLKDAVDAYYKDGWWVGVISTVLENSRYIVTFHNPPDEIEFGVSDLRLHQDWVNGNWFSGRELAGLKCPRKRVPGTKRYRWSLDKKSARLRREQDRLLSDPEIHKEGNQLESGDSGQERRKGGPPEVLFDIPTDSATNISEDQVPVKITAKNGAGQTKTTILVPTRHCLGLITGDDRIWENDPSKQAKKPSSSMEIPSAKKNKPLAKRFIEAYTVEALDVRQELEIAMGKLPKKKSDEMAMDKLPRNMSDEKALNNLLAYMSDDQPLSTWFDGIHFPTPVDGSRISAGTTMEQRNNGGQSQNEILTQSALADANSVIAPGEIRTLPCVRNIIWETIQSVEVFKRMPQKPHFHPLDGYNECKREGLAIGSMVTFSNVVENTTKLQIGHPKSKIKESLEILSELETSGFNVQVVRDRLNKLLSTKENQEQFEDQIKELECQIGEHNLKMMEVNEELDNIDKQIKELQERSTLTELRKEKVNSEIGSLQRKLDDIIIEVANTRSNFESLATSSWW